MSAVKEALQRIEARAEWMKEHAEEMLELLKDAHPFITDGDVRTRVGNIVAKVERIR